MYMPTWSMVYFRSNSIIFNFFVNSKVELVSFTLIQWKDEVCEQD